MWTVFFFLFNWVSKNMFPSPAKVLAVILLMWSIFSAMKLNYTIPFRVFFPTLTVHLVSRRKLDNNQLSHLPDNLFANCPALYKL